jgi:hypothetical protein
MCGFQNHKKFKVLKPTPNLFSPSLSQYKTPRLFFSLGPNLIHMAQLLLVAQFSPPSGPTPSFPLSSADRWGPPVRPFFHLQPSASPWPCRAPSFPRHPSLFCTPSPSLLRVYQCASTFTQPPHSLSLPKHLHHYPAIHGGLHRAPPLCRLFSSPLRLRKGDPEPLHNSHLLSTLSSHTT